MIQALNAQSLGIVLEAGGFLCRGEIKLGKTEISLKFALLKNTEGKIFRVCY